MNAQSEEKRMSMPFEAGREPSRINKVQRYQWKALGDRGRAMDLPKQSLRVHGHADGGYQRDMNDPRRLNIAREFTWDAFGVLIVAERPDGSRWIIDGQTRHAAAMERPDIASVPCLVFQMATLKEESKAFLRLNKNRALPTTLQMLPAQTHAGDPLALAVNDLIAATGRAVSKNSSATTFACVTALMRALRTNAGAIERLWPILIDLTRGHPFHNMLLEGLWYIEGHLPEGLSLSDSVFRRRLLNVGYVELLEAAGRAAAYYAKGGAKIWAQGIRDRLNKGASKNIIPVVD